MRTQIENGTIPGAKIPEYLDWFGMRCQSWTSEMSDKMWEEYGDNKSGVCVAVEIRNITQLKYKSKDGSSVAPVESLEIEYKDNLSDISGIEEQIHSSVGKNEFYFTQILKYKSIKYSFEKEWRFYVSMLGIDEEEWISDEHGVYIPIEEDMSLFINKVWTHPNISSEVESNVKDFCLQYGIKYSK